MLILSRNVSETLFIGDDIKITVLEVNGNQVRIGIDAPRDIAVMREELLKNNRSGNAHAAKPRPYR